MLKFLIKNHSFLKFFLGDFTGKVADQYFAILLPFLMLFVTKDPLYLAIVLAMNAVGRVIMLPFGGVLIDRYRPQLFLMANNLIQALGLIYIIYLFSTESLGVFTLGFIALIFGITDGVSLPASGAITPKLVQKEDLLRANSLVQGLEMLTGIVGPLLAGLIIANFGLYQGILVSIIIYSLSFISYSTIINLQINEPKAESEVTFFRDFKEGWHEVKTNRVVSLFLILSATSNIFVMGCVTVGLLLLLQNKLGLGADYYSYIGVFFSLGFIFAVLFVNRIKKIHYPGRLHLVFGALYFLIFLGIGFSLNIWVINAIIFFTGIVVAFDATISSTWLQSSVDSKIMGRVTSFIIFSTIAVDPLGQALAGFTARYSLEYLFVIAALGCLLVPVINYIANPAMRKRYDLSFEAKH